MKRSSSNLALRIYLPVAMLVVVAAMYSNALQNPFLTEDQHVLLGAPGLAPAPGVPPAPGAPPSVAPELVPGMSIDQPLAWLWRSDAGAGESMGAQQYRPIVTASYLLNATVAGPVGPPAYRVVNVLILACIGWITALWLSRYVNSAVAWLAAFLLVAHPTNYESINLIVGRAQLLAMLGIVGFAWQQSWAIYHGRWTQGRMLAAFLFALLAVGSDTMGLLLAPLALVQAYLPRDCGQGRAWWLHFVHTHTPAEETPRRVHLATATLLGAPLLLYALGRTAAIGWQRPLTDPNLDLTTNPLLSMGFLERLAPAISRAGYYTKQLFAPDLSFGTIPGTLPGWTSASTLVGLMVIVASVIALVVWLRQRQWMAIPMTLGLGYYLLASNLILPGPIYCANRFMPPFTLAAVMVLASFLDHLVAGSLRRRALAIIPVALGVVVMVVVVFVHNQAAKDMASLRLADLKRQLGNPVAQYQYAAALMDASDTRSALFWLERVADYRPQSRQARRQLAVALLLEGQPGRAEAQYRQLLNLAPDDVDALNQLATMALQRGELDAAQAHLKKAVCQAPDDPQTIYSLARLEIRRGNLHQALAHYEHLLRLQPRHVPGLREYRDLMQGLDGTARNGR
ncbi:MAG: tetratricopeptide repeat protein [Phycisphaeraceae bacterium]